MSPLPLHHCHRRIVEPDDFDDAVSGISLHVEFQRRQEKPSAVEQFQTPSWALDFGATGVGTRVSGVLRGGWASFCFSLGPASATWNGREAPPGTITLLPPGAEVAGRTGSGFAWVTAAIPPEAWQQCLRLAGVEEAPHQLAACAIPCAELARIRDTLFQSQIRLRVPDGMALQRAASATSNHLIEAFTLAVEASGAGDCHAVSARNRSRLARRAESWMREHLGAPCRVPEICLALGVSRRELEYAFRMVFDQSPRERLETLRMHAIRRALLNSDGDRETVIGIAFNHGVAHLGRFAATYRSLFGENPGQTRRRPMAGGEPSLR